MAIIGNLPVTLTNGTLADATAVMSLFSFLQAQVNANAVGLAVANNFTGSPQQVGGDTIATLTATQSLSNKTLATPIITGLSGLLVPTLTNTTNISSSSVNGNCRWLQVGAIATFSGSVNITPTANTGSTVLGIALPVASNFASVFDATGSAVNTTVASAPGAITADIVNKRLTLTFTSSSTSSQTFNFVCQYTVI